MTRLPTIAAVLAFAALATAACDSDLDRTLSHGVTVTDGVTFMPTQPVGTAWADEAPVSAPVDLQETLDQVFDAGHEDHDGAEDVPAAEPTEEPDVPVQDVDPQGPLATPAMVWNPSTSETAPVYAESCRLETEDTLQIASNGAADDTFYFAPKTSPTALMELAVADDAGVQVAADLQLLAVDGGAAWRRARGKVVWVEDGAERTGDVVDGTLCFDTPIAADGHGRAAEFSLIVRTTAGDLFSLGGSVDIPAELIGSHAQVDADANLDIDLR